MNRLAVIGMAALLFMGCARTERTTAPEGAASPTSGGAKTTHVTLDLEIRPDSPIPVGSEVTFQLTMEAREAITLQYATSQRYEFVVERLGTRVWAASDGKAYLQVLGSESLQPGEERRYSESWTPKDSGDYVVTGSITASERANLLVREEFSVE